MVGEGEGCGEYMLRVAVGTSLCLCLFAPSRLCFRVKSEGEKK